MKYTKRKIQEIVDSDGMLIGSDDIPQNGSNLESQANNTTDYNSKISHQPYRYDMLGRFGFTMLPFFEGVDDKSDADPIVSEIAEFLYYKYMEILKHYYKNPKQLQNDYRVKSKLDFKSDESSKHDFEMANKIIDMIKPHFEDAMKNLDENIKNNLDENKFTEGKLLDKKNTEEFSKKKDDDIRDKQLEKIVGLINTKLSKKSINKLVNLLEVK